MSATGEMGVAHPRLKIEKALVGENDRRGATCNLSPALSWDKERGPEKPCASEDVGCNYKKLFAI